MNILNRYFDFKKRNLIDYALFFLDDTKENRKYLDALAQTYINVYYYHFLDAYYDKPVIDFNQNIVINEMQAKLLELLDPFKKDNDEEKIILIKNCYSNFFIAIMIDFMDFSDYSKVGDYKDIILNILNLSHKTDNVDSNVIDKLCSLVKENTIKERKFFLNSVNDDFCIKYGGYIGSPNNYRVELQANIEQLDKNYRKVVVDKIFNDEKISLDKLEATINLFSIDLIKKIIGNERVFNYFINIPLTNIKRKNEFEEILESFDNPKVINNVIFIINYNDYISNKSLFKGMEKYHFAILVDFSKVISVEKRLAEIDSFDLFRYVIVDGVKEKDYALVNNYVIKGKEKFNNEVV